MSDDDVVKKWLANELENCEAAYRSGVQAALTDALFLCLTMKQTAPEWVVAAAEEVTGDAAGGVVQRGIGRTASAAARYRADIVHFDRWASVKDIREKQIRHRGTLDRIIKDDPADPMIHRVRALIEKVGETWDDAYNAASAILRGTFAQGSPGAMKDSYQFVEREVKAGNAARFYIPHSERVRNFLE